MESFSSPGHLLHCSQYLTYFIVSGLRNKKLLKITFCFSCFYAFFLFDTFLQFAKSERSKPSRNNGKMCSLNKLLVHSVPFHSKGLTQGLIHITFQSTMCLRFHFLIILASGQLHTQTKIFIALYLGQYDNGHRIGLIGVTLVFD